MCDAEQEMSHLKKCLDDYTPLEAPGYAVLVTGEWGTGKTYQVKECIPEDERLYVSLYGVQTVEQLHSEVVAAYALSMAIAKQTPKKAWIEELRRSWIGRKVKSATTFVLQKFKPGSGNVDAIQMFYPWMRNYRKLLMAVLWHGMKNDMTLVFDDLERRSSGLDLNAALGAINHYVEHRNFTVVIIAHDEKLTEEMLVMKEKIIGQTLRVEPQVDKALTHFISGIPDGSAKEFISDHRAKIRGIFNQST